MTERKCQWAHGRCHLFTIIGSRRARPTRRIFEAPLRTTLRTARIYAKKKMRAFHVVSLILVFRSISSVSANLTKDRQVDNNVPMKHSDWSVAELELKSNPPSASPRIFGKSKRDVDEKEEANQYPTRHAKHRRRRRCKYRAGCSRLSGTAKQRVYLQNSRTSSDHNPEFALKNDSDLADANIVLEKQGVVEESNQDLIPKTLVDNEDDENYERELSYFRVTDLIKETTTSSSIDSSSPVFNGKQTLTRSEDKSLARDSDRVQIIEDAYNNSFEDSSMPSWMDENNNNKKSISVGVRSSPIYAPIDDQATLHEGLATLLIRLFQTLRNASAEDSHDLLKGLNFVGAVNEDPCQKWLNSNDKFERAFLGPFVTLPSCPCQYPSNIFYDDKIWDQKQQRHFRWRDVSGESQRLDVYKPGAAYCVRSLLAQGSGSAAAQHCCYDRRRRLITRGSGAGTPNFVSPEISAILHEKIDVLPWRLCKGDFSRFNKVRPPNNDNGCEPNPDDDEYQRQIDSTKYY